MPEGNRPGPRSERAPDEADPDAFARRLGVIPEHLRDPAIKVGRFVARFTTVPVGYARGAVRGVRGARDRKRGDD